jgi:hypothetical protein
VTGPSRLAEVVLLQLPVPLWSRSQQLFDELMREFALATSQADDGDDHHVPAKLTRLIDDLQARFGGGSSEQEDQLHGAAAAGQEVIDRLVFTVPVEAGPATVELGDMMDAADQYCREGRHLLTLAAPEEVVAFRHWYLAEFARQIAGRAPVPWPEHDGVWPPVVA